MSGVLESTDLRQPVPPTSSSERLSYYKRSLSTDPYAEPLRTTIYCEKCPSCIQIRNINEYSHESTPLLASSISMLRDARCYDKALIGVFFFILIFGSGIGLYLLYIEDDPAILEEFDYVSRETWGINSTFLQDLPPLQAPLSKVLLQELITNCTDALNHCIEYEEFFDKDKEKMRIFNGEVLYNFYQDRSGRIFEGRGWKFRSDCGQQGGCEDILTIGVIEELKVAPTSKQIGHLKAFLDYSVSAEILNSCYEILVSHRQARYFDDLAYTLREMNRKDGTCNFYD